MKVLKFEEVFGLAFGAAAHQKLVNLEGVNTDIEFTTPGHTEQGIMFSFPLRSIVFGHRHTMQLFDAETGEPVTSRNGVRMHFHVGPAPDPKAVPHAHPSGFVGSPGVQLEPSHDYILRIIPLREAPDLEMGIWYSGKDGGEQPLAEVDPEPAPDGTIEVAIAGIEGIWVPRQ